MDPKATLDRIKDAIADRDWSEATAGLQDYWSWRRKGGFQPPGGDKKARALELETMAKKRRKKPGTLQLGATGPAMRAAAEYVRRHPGTAILPVAKHVGPHGSKQYGYRTVHRAIDAGLIRVAEKRGGQYVLMPGKKSGTLKGAYKSSVAANRRRYSKIAAGSPVTRSVPRACAIVQSGGKKGKIRKGCRMTKNGARCDVLTRLPREARARIGKKFKLIDCPS